MILKPLLHSDNKRFAPIGCVQEMLGWLDLLIFFLMLGISIALGIYFGFCGNKQKSPSEYLLGSKAMTPVPIAMSLIATVISGIFLIGLPTDVYKFGASYFWLNLAVPMCCIVTLYVYVPVFVKLESASISHYLEVRFNRKTRILASVMFTIKLILYNPIVMYISSLVLSFASDLDTSVVSAISCVICIFYTTVGGFKAVVWTDTIQTVAIYSCMFVVICLGIAPVGGFSSIWNKALDGQRLDVLNINLDLTDGTSVWAFVIGGSFYLLSEMGINQGIIQRFMALPTRTDTKKSMFIFGVGYILIASAVFFCGLEVYGLYAECDPILDQKLKRYDLVLPYFVNELSRNIPGLLGLFIAGIFSGSLSTLSTTLNSLSAIIYSDFLSGFIPKDYHDQKRSLILKAIVVVMGLSCIALVFLVEQLGGIIPLTLSLNAVTGGPLLAIYTLGIVFPIANSKGALCGGTVGLLFSSWIIFGNQWYKLHGLIKEVTKPFSIDGCNSTTNATFSLATNIEEPFFAYRISYWYYTILGAGPTIIIGLIVSWITRDKDAKVSPELISPVFRFLLKENEKQKNDSGVTNDGFRIDEVNIN